MSVAARVLQAFKNLRLARKFTLAVVFIMAVVVAAVTTLIVSYQRDSLRAEVDRHHLSLARNLAKDVVGPLIFLDPLRLDEMVRAIDQTPGCTSAAILDRNGRVVAHTDRKRLGEVIPPGPRSARAEEGKGPIGEVAGAGAREIVVPVTVGYEVIGTVMVGFSPEQREGLIEGDLEGLKRYLVTISSLALLLGLAVALGLARLLTTPLKRLKETMERVQEGDLTAHVELGQGERCKDIMRCEESECPAYGGGECWTIPGTRCFGAIQGDVASKMARCKSCVVFRRHCGDEIGELTAAFNRMVKRLRENMQRLEETTGEKARLERVAALGEMSMTVAHEIKNPLNAIRGAVSCLHDGVGDSKEFLAIIDEETSRLDELVTSFLRFSKPPPLRLQTADVNQIVKDTVRLVRQEATEVGVELLLSLDERVPRILLDAQQFRQALLNILVNALGATKDGDTVSVATGVAGSRVQIAVVDTGAGIAEEIVEDIFKPFFTTKTRGSGLGLACVERIVREHGGDVAVKSRLGKGTEFAITLPFERSNG